MRRVKWRKLTERELFADVSRRWSSCNSGFCGRVVLFLKPPCSFFSSIMVTRLALCFKLSSVLAVADATIFLT